MEKWETIAAKLAEPFPDVKYRVGSTTKKRDPQTKKYPDGTKGQALAYIDARQAFDRLDYACGVENWSDSFELLPGGGVQCRLTITGLDSEGRGVQVTREDVGYPNGKDSAEPMKDAFSDALKRAGVHFGMGRYLYDLESKWLPIDARGNFTDAPKYAAPEKPADAPAYDNDLKRDYAAMMEVAHDAGEERVKAVRKALGDPKNGHAALAAFIALPDAERTALIALANGAEIAA